MSLLRGLIKVPWISSAAVAVVLLVNAAQQHKHVAWHRLISPFIGSLNTRCDSFRLLRDY